MALRIIPSKAIHVFSTKYYNQSIPKYYFSTERQCYDIIISGGGLIGQTVACILSKNSVLKDYSILLIESSSKKPLIKSQDYSNRVSAIIPATKKLFEDIGIWKNINRFQVVNDMKVWGYFSKEFIHFTHENPAYIIENNDIINAALRENEKAKNVKILNDASIKEVILSEEKKKKHVINLNDGRSFETSLLIGSDGPGSLIRKAMNTQYLSWEYDQYGIVGTLYLSNNESENTTAWERFVPDGTIALLPLSSGISSLVWSTSKKKAKDLLELPNDLFVDALNESIQAEPRKNEIVETISACANSIINSITSTRNMSTLDPPYIKSVVDGSRAAFPLSFGHSSEYVGPSVALVGDSAHKVHPLAGQGVNIGFRDIRTLEKKLVEGILNGRPLGDTIDLAYYETECQRTNIPIMASIEFMHRVYTSKFEVVQALGNVGFNFVNSFGPVKALMKRAAAF